jgi:NAD-dependent dihydropyrimidine dehydrogenase PreA subunit
MPQVSIDYDNCINCKTCTQICPMGVYKDEGEKVSIVDGDECIACMGCVGACPVDTITVIE